VPEQSRSRKPKRDAPEATYAPSQEPAAPSDAERLPFIPLTDAPAAGGGPALLSDARLPAVQRQRVAAWVGRTRGNRRLGRMIASARRAGDAVQREVATAPTTFEQRIREAIEGPGTDIQAIYSTLRTVSVAERTAAARGSVIMGLLRGNLSDTELDRAAILLAAGLPDADRGRVAAGIYDLSAAPAGRIRDAVGLLLVSEELVDRNTARRILDGDVSAHYIEDLNQPPNVAATVTGYGRDPAIWSLYYQPGSTTEMVWGPVGADGFRIPGTGHICGHRSLSLNRWKTLLVHETSHARNPDPTTPLLNYKSEFRAYWVAEYRVIADLNERARQIKGHILFSYPAIKAVYDADATVKAAIDAHTRPDGNITNI
jgi:hypothetical protein